MKRNLLFLKEKKKKEKRKEKKIQQLPNVQNVTKN